MTKPWFIRQENGGLHPCSSQGELHAMATVVAAIVAACVFAVLAFRVGGYWLLGVAPLLAPPVIFWLGKKTVPNERIVPHTDPRVHQTGMALRRKET